MAVTSLGRLAATRPEGAPSRSTSEDTAVDPSEVAEAIAEAARGLRFGSIEVVVHESRVVQIVRTEKRRVLK